MRRRLTGVLCRGAAFVATHARVPSQEITPQWEDAAIVVPERDVPQLHRILANVSLARLVRMRRSMAELWPRLLWNAKLLLAELPGELPRFEPRPTRVRNLRRPTPLQLRLLRLARSCAQPTCASCRHKRSISSTMASR